jgi:hypothetical protein
LQRTASQKFVRSSRRPIKGAGSLREEVPVRWMLGGRAAMDRRAFCPCACAPAVGQSRRAPVRVRSANPTDEVRDHRVWGTRAHRALRLEVPRNKRPQVDADPLHMVQTASVRPTARPHASVLVVHQQTLRGELFLPATDQHFSPPRRPTPQAAGVAAAKNAASLSPRLNSARNA